MTLLDAIQSSDLGYTSFTVERTTYTRTSGTSIPSTQTFSAFGDIHPGTPEMLQLLPEEDRQENFIVVYTDFPLSLGTNDGGPSYTTPDRILYGGKTWRVVRVRDWSAFGYYQGYAALLRE